MTKPDGCLCLLHFPCVHYLCSTVFCVVMILLGREEEMGGAHPLWLSRVYLWAPPSCWRDSQEGGIESSDRGEANEGGLRAY